MRGVLFQPEGCKRTYDGDRLGTEYLREILETGGKAIDVRLDGRAGASQDRSERRTV
jgi:hypothetical protein